MYKLTWTDHRKTPDPTSCLVLSHYVLAGNSFSDTKSMVVKYMKANIVDIVKLHLVLGMFRATIIYVIHRRRSC